MKIKLPKEFISIADIERNSITLRKNEIIDGTIFFAGYDVVHENNFYDDLVKKGASIIFIDREDYNNYKPNSKLPFIIVDNLMEKQGRFFYYVKKQYKIKKTIAITGSVGKTTTTQLLNIITKNEMNSYCSKGNFNSYPSVANHIMNELSDNLDLYIQEIGAAAPTTVEKSAAMIHPNAYILTNVLPHHLNYYKTIENVFIDKTSISKYLKHGGVLITNFDDELIANHKFPHKVISFGINTNKDVDYRAQNIVQNNEFLELDIIYNKNEKCHLKVNIVGKHNAYNILAVFATCKWLGIDNEKISKNLLNFKTKGIRQNIININGIIFYIDCYNVCNDNIKAGIKAIEDMPINKGNKKYAFIGGENKLGSNYYDISYQLGTELKDNKLDNLICYSLADDTQESIDYYGDSRPIYKALKDNNCKNAKLITNHKELFSFMKNNLKPGDIVLIKGNCELDMHAAIDLLFGTALFLDYDYTPSRDAVVSTDIYDMNVKTDFKYGSIDKCHNYTKDIKIPNEIKGYKVHRLGSKLFRKSNIETIDFGTSVANIGFATFARCNSLKKVIIPDNVKWLSESSFANCKNLDEVIIKGATNICENAFYGCSNLKNIEIPNSVLYIHDNAFKNSNNIVFKCNEDSYACKYAKEHNIKYITKRKK